MSNIPHWRVFDADDKWIGNWFALTEILAISAALREGWDAWSARPALGL